MKTKTLNEEIIVLEKAQKIRKVVSQKTLDSKRFIVSNKGEKVKCEFCKGKVVDVIRHLRRCHLNPRNAPKIEIDWDYIEQYREVENCLIKDPSTEKMKEFNNTLAPKGNPFREFEALMLNYAINLPKAHKDKVINQKLDEILTSGIQLRLLNREEFFDRLKDKVRKDYRLFLFDPLKPTTIEEIEQNEDILWQEQEKFAKKKKKIYPTKRD